MDRHVLKAEERTVLGKKVKLLRKSGLTPGHVFGNTTEAENVSVPTKDFLAIFAQAGETGLIDLRIGDEKVRPVLIRNLQLHAVTEEILNIDFFQVNLKEKVTVPVPIELIGEEQELVHIGEAIVLQNLSEVEVEALPTDLIEKIEVNIEVLKAIDDAITVADLNYDRSKLTVLAEPEEVVVKLAPAVTEEMKALLEEQDAEAEAAAAEATEAEAGETAEGEASESETEDTGEAATDAGEQPKEATADESSESEK